MSITKKKDEDTIFNEHVFQHQMLHNALPIKVDRDERGVHGFHDVDAYQYNLFRGENYGEGHADRLLDDFLNRRKHLSSEEQEKFDSKFSVCLEYQAYLRSQKMNGIMPPIMTVRRRLMKNL
tara:strand:- start:266 stop:631 length:366 start_codon:yes stop_codon:yes gene_type:complete